MRSRLPRNFAFAFAGTLGLAGAASANPDHFPREGSVPAHAIRADIAVRAAFDGRGETATMERPTSNDAAFNTPEGHHHDGGLELRAFAVPMKSDLTNRLNMRDDGDDPKAANLRTDVATHRHSSSCGCTYRAPSNEAPIQIKSDIALRVDAGEESLVKPVVHADDDRAKRYGQSRGGWMADQRQKVGDASQAELRDPRKYPGRNENIPTPAQSVSKVSLHHGAGAGDASNEPTP